MTRLAIAALLCATAAHAEEPVCGPYDGMVAAVPTKWREVVVMRGLEERGGMIEVYVGEDGTWTMLVVGPTKIACMILSGTNAELYPFIPGVLR